MKYLSAEAAKCYFSLSIDVADYRLISRTPLFIRLITLSAMCAPEDPVRDQIGDDLQGHDLEVAFEAWGDDEQTDDATGISAAEAVASVTEEHRDKLGRVVLEFSPGSATGLPKWKFHQADPDFFPSIPHGHWEGRPQPKLDAYLGWVYLGSAQIRREPRQHIIALWNDEKFREFAGHAIDYYLTNFPRYIGWRVPDPRRLPRRR
jgi:hypothetical protein